MLFSQNKYPQNIKSACNIYCTQYSETDKSNNNRDEVNDKGQDNNNYDNDDEKKDYLINAHTSMDSTAAILVAHVSNDSMWDTTHDDIGSLAG